MSKLAGILQKARRSVAYLAEKAVLDFTGHIGDLMEKEEVNRSELARRIGASPAYVTKVLRGDQNVTVKTMVSLANALGADLEIRVVERAALRRQTEWWAVGSIEVVPYPAVALPALDLGAANENQWQTLLQAA